MIKTQDFFINKDAVGSAEKTVELIGEAVDFIIQNDPRWRVVYKGLADGSSESPIASSFYYVYTLKYLTSAHNLRFRIRGGTSSSNQYTNRVNIYLDRTDTVASSNSTTALASINFDLQLYTSTNLYQSLGLTIITGQKSVSLYFGDYTKTTPHPGSNTFRITASEITDISGVLTPEICVSTDLTTWYLNDAAQKAYKSQDHETAYHVVMEVPWNGYESMKPLFLMASDTALTFLMVNDFYNFSNKSGLTPGMVATINDINHITTEKVYLLQKIN